MWYSQRRYSIRCEWGEHGVRTLGAISDVLVIVDVLSFTTAVSVAVERGGIVWPFPYNEGEPEAFAANVGAELAVKRGADGISLSPASLMGLVKGSKLVLPSPNGSALTHQARELGPTVLAGSLRNAAAVARAAMQLGNSVGVVPAGERWSDRSLRPALEDWIGAGAIIASLAGEKSPEAEAAEHIFTSVADRLPETLRSIGSGRELVERGFDEDVSIAARYDVSDSVPVLRQFPDSTYAYCEATI